MPDFLPLILQKTKATSPSGIGETLSGATFRSLANSSLSWSLEKNELALPLWSFDRTCFETSVEVGVVHPLLLQLLLEGALKIEVTVDWTLALLSHSSSVLGAFPGPCLLHKAAENRHGERVHLTGFAAAKRAGSHLHCVYLPFLWVLRGVPQQKQRTLSRMNVTRSSTVWSL